MAHEVELEALATYLEKNHLKQTKQRELILHTFLDANRHVTSEDLYQAVRKEHSNIGYTTVYRTMKLLVEAGLATERHFDDGITRYEIEHEHHDHLVCVKCGKIQEFECEEIEERQREVATEHGFEILRHRHELYGHCSSCRENA
ncbi:MAG: transcriptional repressor [bacterium]|nr:transcriptional repressor [bacterium]